MKLVREKNNTTIENVCKPWLPWVHACLFRFEIRVHKTINFDNFFPDKGYKNAVVVRQGGTETQCPPHVMAGTGPTQFDKVDFRVLLSV